MAPYNYPHNPEFKGLHAVYRTGERNHCPGCGREHWIIGRQTAECAFCSTAIPLESASSSTQSPSIWKRGKKK